MRIPIRLNWPTVAISKDGRLTAINKKEDTMRAATNTTNDNTDDLDTMTDAAAKLALAIAQYGNGAGLPNDHPWHQLKSLHGEMTAAIATERKRRKDAGKEVVEADALGPHMGRGARSEPFDGGDLVKRSFEDALQARADRLALEKGITPEKAYVALLAQHQSVHKGFRDRHPSMPAQDAAWAAIELAADSLIEKSSAPMSREKAIDKVLKSRLDLSRAYYGGGINPLGDRVR